MAEAERLRVMVRPNTVRALQLRQETIRLIQEAGRPGPARQAAKEAYRNQLLQNQALSPRT